MNLYVDKICSCDDVLWRLDYRKRHGRIDRDTSKSTVQDVQDQQNAQKKQAKRRTAQHLQDDFRKLNKYLKLPRIVRTVMEALSSFREALSVSRRKITFEFLPKI